MSDAPANPAPTSDEPSFSELWRDTLQDHRHVERWRAMRFRSALVAVAATIALGAHGSGIAPWLPGDTPTRQVEDLLAVAEGASPPLAPTTNDALRATDYVQLPPTPVIFDTDMINGIDDPLALAMVHGYRSMGMVDLLAVTVNQRDTHVASYIDALNTAYGGEDIPIAMTSTGGVIGGRDAFHRVVADAPARFPRDLNPDEKVDDAVLVLRRTLARQDDRSVVIIATGHTTNLAQLLASPPDGISPLDGRDLVAAKVKLLAITAGDVARATPEHNPATDPESTRAVFESWPSPIVASEWQVGADLPFPGQTLADDPGAASKPLLTSAELYGRNALFVEFPYDPPSFDLTTVLYAVEPDAYFSVSEPGHLSLDDQLVTRFERDPAGLHRLIERPADRGTRQRITNRLADMVNAG